jgi:hypothetical protein
MELRSRGCSIREKGIVDAQGARCWRFLVTGDNGQLRDVFGDRVWRQLWEELWADLRKENGGSTVGSGEEDSCYLSVFEKEFQDGFGKVIDWGDVLEAIGEINTPLPTMNQPFLIM